MIVMMKEIVMEVVLVGFLGFESEGTHVCGICLNNTYDHFDELRLRRVAS